MTALVIVDAKARSYNRYDGKVLTNRVRVTRDELLTPAEVEQLRKTGHLYDEPAPDAA